MVEPVTDTGHRPVLLEETLAALAVREEGIYVDCTFGRGGHASQLLQRLGQGGRLVAIDRDPQAVALAKSMAEADPRLSVHHGAFDCLQTLVEQLQLRGRIDGILFDLGVSSPQLNDAGRGFSFMRDGPLDMRMDSSGGHTAAEWIAQASEHEIADCLHHYGEERHARRIARAIVAVRRERPITTTGQLAEIAARAHPDWQHGQHPATRTFQAIRILINDELNMLKRGLVQALEVLAIGGRLLVISFHSLEDRIVKQFIRRETGKTDGASRLPTAHLARLRIIGKAIRPSHDEVAGNPRARSAVLRVAEKLA